MYVLIFDIDKIVRKIVSKNHVCTIKTLLKRVMKIYSHV